MRKKTGNIAVAVAAFMAVAGLGISSGAGRIDVLAANPQTKAEKANSDESKKSATKRPLKVMRQKKKPQPHLRLQLMKRIRMNQAAPEYRRRKDFQRALA